MGGVTTGFGVCIGDGLADDKGATVGTGDLGVTVGTNGILCVICGVTGLCS